jgi:putative DNA methylase
MTASQFTTPRQKLIEVSIPLEAINAAAEQVKKKAPKGYFTGLHKYWSQKPLPASRGILFAQLVDDPSSCPEEFSTKEAQDAERDRLHRLISNLVPWEASGNEEILNEARYEIARSVARARGNKLPPIGQMTRQQIIRYLQEHAPPVYDPFSGGASIPLEAQRLGLKAIGSDLNPVAVLIGKALVEFPPMFAGCKPVNPQVNELHQWKGAQGLADDVRYYGLWIRKQAEKKIGHLYPKIRMKDGKEATVCVWLWTRTVPSPDPRAKGAHVPVVSSFVLSAKIGKEVIVKPVVNRDKMTWAFEIDHRPSKGDIEAAKKGTKAARGANFVCLLTGAAIDDMHVKTSGKTGNMGASLMAIVAEGNRSRIFLAPNTEQVEVAHSAQRPDVSGIEQPVPERLTGGTCFGYGLDRFDKLFTPRQLVALTTFSDLVMEARDKVLTDARKHWSGAHADDTRRLGDGGVGPVAYADAVACYHSIILGRMVGYSSSLTTWLPKDSALRHAMPRQALQMMWETAEANPLGTSSGDFETCTRAIASYLDQFNGPTQAFVELRDASSESTPRRLFALTRLTTTTSAMRI